MKYPAEQYNKLIENLPILLSATKLKHLPASDFNDSDYHQLHFMLYTQLTFSNENANVRNSNWEPLIEKGGKRLMEIDEDFKLYPTGCNDNHIETAMKSALKQICPKQ